MRRACVVACLLAFGLFVSGCGPAAQEAYGVTRDGQVKGECIAFSMEPGLLGVSITNESSHEIDPWDANVWCFDTNKVEVEVLAPGTRSQQWAVDEARGDFNHEDLGLRFLTSKSFGYQKPILPGTTARTYYLVGTLMSDSKPVEFVMEVPGHGKLRMKIEHMGADD